MIRLAFLFIAAIAILTGCSPQLRPCCRFKPGYSSIERSRTVKLRTKPPQEVASYTNGNYMVLVKQKNAERKLSRFISSYSDTLTIGKVFDQKRDTLELNVKGTNHRVEKYMMRRLSCRRAVVIDRSTGLILQEAEKVAFNFLKGPRWGAGGKAFLHEQKTIVILYFWKS